MMLIATKAREWETERKRERVVYRGLANNAQMICNVPHVACNMLNMLAQAQASVT